MGFRSVLISDVSGNEIPEDKAVEMVVRTHPDLDAPKRFDVSEDEVVGMNEASNVVTVELKRGSGEVETKILTVAEFEKVVPKKALANGSNTRGRRPGFSPNRPS